MRHVSLQVTSRALNGTRWLEAEKERVRKHTSATQALTAAIKKKEKAQSERKRERETKSAEGERREPRRLYWGNCASAARERRTQLRAPGRREA